jgi:hypothetical protein
VKEEEEEVEKKEIGERGQGSREDRGPETGGSSEERGTWKMMG